MKFKNMLGRKGNLPNYTLLVVVNGKKIKQRVKSSVKELAEDLLKLYAERSSRKGHAFGEDTLWQKEFEDYFPYELTPDQKQAVIDIKKRFRI